MPQNNENLNDFQVITSTQNFRIKLLKKLALKKYRHEQGLFFIESLTIIYDALASGYDFESFFMTDEFVSKNKKSIDAILKLSNCTDYFLVDDKINKHYSQLDTASGITAVFKLQNKELSDASVIYLNSVGDPGNLGTILRSALAFGFVNMVLDENCADVYNAKAINAARDAIFKINIAIDHSGKWLKNCPLPIYASSSHIGQDLENFRPKSNFCLVLGSESYGVSSKILDKAAKTIRIETTGQIESLNVASAAAILLYQFRKIK
jgi:RNA methyltransferase, TrmH family